MKQETVIREKFLLMKPTLNEQSCRRWVATEAKVLGRGGVSLVARATGVSRNTIAKGLNELKIKPAINGKRLRKEGGGRKRCTVNDKTLERDIERLVEPTSRGDPESPLRYTIKSIRVLEQELKQQGHQATYPTIAAILHQKGYSLQANKKTREGTNHPDRNAQFEFINNDVKNQQQSKEPVISVDAKKKELVGDFKNNGREWHPKGMPEEVRMHDFEIPDLGKVVPYGIYDVDRNHGWINLGIDNNTAEFAVESIRQWWNTIGKKSYPNVKTLTITADSGGSNSPHARLWKTELQQLSNESGLFLRVRHFPPGTSKWNKVEHRLFSFISQNWRGKPLISHAVIINLIASTTTKTGLKVECRLDTKKYPTGRKISDEAYDSINLAPEQFHGEWNYTIKPNK